VLDGVAITALGRKGGYFYNIYLNLPAAGDVDADRQSHFLGTVGPFEVSGASHHGATLSYPATEVLRTIGAAVLSEAVVSFVRVNGTGYPKGEVLKVGEMRLEVSTDAQ
jgi:tyrosinase